MHLSICIDAAPEAAGPSAFAGVVDQARRIEAAAADFVLIARETAEGRIAPSRIEAIVAQPWLAGRLSRSVVVAAIPALHAVPFHIARALSASDFLSAGRAGWMPLTSGHTGYDAAYGAGYAVPEAEVTAKYEDFIRATQALWDSWDDDALVIDAASGVYLDSSKIRRVDYRGPYYATMGALNAARPPQGHPLLVRDLGDVAATSLPSDVLIGDREQLAGSAIVGPIRLLKTGRETMEANIALIGQGAADGLHLTGVDAPDMLDALRARYPARTGSGSSARARLGLQHPINPYSNKAAA